MSFWGWSCTHLLVHNSNKKLKPIQNINNQLVSTFKYQEYKVFWALGTYQRVIFVQICSNIYLTMRHAATPVQSLPVGSSGCEKCWQGLKERNISALADMFSAGTALKRPRKPSASPIAFKFITPLPSFMMHLQLLTLKQPGFSAEFGCAEREEENMLKERDNRKAAWRLMVTERATEEDGDKDRALRYL